MTVQPRVVIGESDVVGLNRGFLFGATEGGHERVVCGVRRHFFACCYLCRKLVLVLVVWLFVWWFCVNFACFAFSCFLLKFVNEFERVVGIYSEEVRGEIEQWMAPTWSS